MLESKSLTLKTAVGNTQNQSRVGIERRSRKTILGRRSMNKSRVGAALLLSMLAGAVSLGAQTHFASFTGIISGNGNPIANVEVVATNVATQVTYTARSNDQGLYTISALPNGTYKVRAQAQGFQINE